MPQPKRQVFLKSIKMFNFFSKFYVVSFHVVNSITFSSHSRYAEYFAILYGFGNVKNLGLTTWSDIAQITIKLMSNQLVRHGSDQYKIHI